MIEGNPQKKTSNQVGQHQDLNSGHPKNKSSVYHSATLLKFLEPLTNKIKYVFCKKKS